MKISSLEKVICAYLGGWERRLSASKMANALGLAREHVSRKTMTWAKSAFCLSEPEGSLHTVFIEDVLEALPPGLRSPREMMDSLPGLLLLCGGNIERPSIVRLGNLFSSEGDPDIFRQVYSAMCRKEALLLSYKAKSGDMSMWFSPHSLVDLPQRPHFRGHVHWIRDGDWAFIDVVPSRIAFIEEASKERYIGGVQDVSWNTIVDLRLRLSTELPEDIRSTIIQEWGHQIRQIDGQVILKIKEVREPLANYIKDVISWRTFRGKIHNIWSD